MAIDDLRFAAKMRDLVAAIAEETVTRLRPSDSFATVDSVSSLSLTAQVIFPGETVPVPVAYSSHRPLAGDVVRISGRSSDRWISEITIPIIARGQWYSAWGLWSPIIDTTPGQSGITAVVDVTGSGLAWTPLESRYYVHYARAKMIHTSGGSVTYRLTDSSNAGLSTTSVESRGAGEASTHHMMTKPKTYSAVARTDKLRVEATASSATSSTIEFWVQDVGPSSA